jgi:uncharacterized protein
MQNDTNSAQDIKEYQVSSLERRLLEALTAMPVIDCHEHLSTEDGSGIRPNDLFRLFSQWSYIGMDLEHANMPHEEYLSLLDTSLPLEQRWDLFEPYWEQVRHTCYARCISLSAERLYGVRDINRSTYQDLSQAMSISSGSGLIQWILRDICNIRRCITDTGDPVVSDLFAPLARVDFQCDLECWDGLTHISFAPTAHIETLDDVLDTFKDYMRECKRHGTVGIKTVALNHGTPDRARALDLFADLKQDRVKRLAPPDQPFPYHLGQSNPLRDYVHDEVLCCAGELGLVVSVHAGYWGDFRNVSPLHLIPEIMRHPEVRFDVFHLGYPWIRETLMLAKGFANVWLNLCWVHIISQHAAGEALDEILDLLPISKVLAFGGDFGTSSVECIYGHLAMSRQNIASALVRCIQASQLSEEKAIRIAQKWYWDNPVQLYGLNSTT